MQAIQVISNQLSMMIATNKAETDTKIEVMLGILDTLNPDFRREFDIGMITLNSKHLHFVLEQKRAQGDFTATAEITKVIEGAKARAIERGGNNTNPKENPFLKAFWDGKSEGMKMVLEVTTAEIEEV
jgi:hypothetical protein